MNCPMCGEPWNAVRCLTCDWREATTPACRAVPERDANLWRAVCACGWRSKLCRFKSGAARACKYHNRGGAPLTVSTKRSRTPRTLRARHDGKVEGRYKSGI